MDALPLAFTTGWASGINTYLVVLVLGVADRIGDYASIPDVLARADVLGVAGVLYAMEFIADKIPYLDSTWDAVSTAIRPTAGAVIAVLLAGDATSLDQAVLAAVGGGSALVAHSVKMGTRLGVNASPEPFSNIAISLTEDVTVLGVVALAIAHPQLAAGIAGVLLLGGLVVLLVLGRLIARGWRRWRRPGPAPGIG